MVERAARSGVCAPAARTSFLGFRTNHSFLRRQRRDSRPVIAGYQLDGENFVAVPEEMTTPGRIESITTIAKERINDVIPR
ncbi:hypothetical protein MRX96_010393 [Rhipicephalus microplus]